MMIPRKLQIIRNITLINMFIAVLLNKMLYKTNPKNIDNKNIDVNIRMYIC